MHTLDPTSIITVRIPDIISRFILRVVGDPVFSARDHTYNGIALSARIERLRQVSFGAFADPNAVVQLHVHEQLH